MRLVSWLVCVYICRISQIDEKEHCHFFEILHIRFFALPFWWLRLMSTITTDLWFWVLMKVNQQLGLGIDLDAWKPFGEPPLGLFSTYKDVAQRIETVAANQKNELVVNG